MYAFSTYKEAKIGQDNQQFDSESPLYTSMNLYYWILFTVPSGFAHTQFDHIGMILTSESICFC